MPIDHIFIKDRTKMRYGKKTPSKKVNEGRKRHLKKKRHTVENSTPENRVW